MRYHSLVVDPGTLPAELEVVATAADDATEIHGIHHRTHPVWGVQFHPESILTEWSGPAAELSRARRVSGRLVALLLAIAGAAGALEAQRPTTPFEAPVRVRDVGPGRSGRILRNALAAPHATFVADTGILALPRDTAYATSVIAIGRHVTVASQVHGDVIVVGGDLFLHPGAVIDGRAVAIGGGVYNSTLAVVRNGRLSYRDNTFDVASVADTLVLDYRALGGQAPDLLYLPGVLGFVLPSYDRVNGLSLPWGVAAAFDTARIVLEPSVTYRSHLGAFDPAVALRAQLGRRNVVAVTAGRGTFTNDRWIRPDPLNSVGAFAAGVDARNYYRADRGELRVARLWERETVEFEPFLGALTELARSVGPRLDAPHTPYSLLNRRDSLGMLRPNPPVRRGRISSALAGGRARWEDGGLVTTLVATVEAPFDAPGGARFVQTTLDAEAAFAAILDHRFEFFAHAVLTAGDSAPPQRFAYVGGTSTLLTLDLLEIGGDQLLFTESRYSIPLDRLVLPLLGAPTIMLRHLAGSAGVARLPAFVHNVGVRVTLSALRFDLLVDPETRDTEVGVSLAFFR
jgi:hypothetical protein